MAEAGAIECADREQLGWLLFERSPDGLELIESRGEIDRRQKIALLIAFVERSFGKFDGAIKRFERWIYLRFVHQVP